MPKFSVIAEIVGYVCLVTAFLDMGMNGRYAGWAGYGLAIAGVCGIAMWLTGSMSWT